MEDFPEIIIRGGPSGDRAALRHGADIWEIIMVARDYGDDLDGICEHFGSLTREELDQALAYAARFPDEIEERLRANEECGERLRREAESRGSSGSRPAFE
jgi:hypothetical protein